MADYVCDCRGWSGRTWLESLPLQVVNAHKVGSAQWPSSNLETKVISKGKKKGGIPLTDYLILSQKKSQVWILYLKNYEKEEQHLSA